MVEVVVLYCGVQDVEFVMLLPICFIKMRVGKMERIERREKMRLAQNLRGWPSLVVEFTLVKFLKRATIASYCALDELLTQEFQNFTRKMARVI